MTDDSLTFRDMYRANPVEGALFTIVPALLAVVQLTNSFVTDLSFYVSVPFALVVVGFAWVLNQHSFAQFRRRRLEGRV